MNNILDIALANLPLVLSVLAGLGLWKVAAALIRKIVDKAKALAKGTSNTVDDAVVAVVASQLEEVARLLEAGDLSEAKRRIGIVKLQSKPLVGMKF